MKPKEDVTKTKEDVKLLDEVQMQKEWQQKYGIVSFSTLAVYKALLTATGFRNPQQLHTLSGVGRRQTSTILTTLVKQGVARIIPVSPNVLYRLHVEDSAKDFKRYLDALLEIAESYKADGAAA